jgi:large subunit ribosomal protein L7/L12
MTDDQVKDVQEAAEEVKEAAEEVKDAAEAVAEGDAKEAKVEAEKAGEKAEEAVQKAEEAVKEEPKAEKKPEPTGKFKDIIKNIEGLSALELSELVKALEERFGVSAAAPVAVAAGGAAPAGDAGADEEKANYNVMLKDGGSNKIGAIKAVREVLPELGLVEAKALIESAPKAIKENVPTEEAKAMKEKLEAAGATVELQ